MKRISAPFLVVCIVKLANPSAASADPATVIPRVGIGYMQYKLTTPDRVDSEGNLILPGDRFVDEGLLAGAGLTAVKDKFYLDLYGQATEEAEDEMEKVDTPTGHPKVKGDRKEMSLALGYAMTEYVSLYVGYKWGWTSVSGDFIDADFDEDGAFIGGAAGLDIFGKGIVSANLAVASLDGKLKSTAPLLPASDTDAISEAVGVAYGISWRSSITEALGYALSLDGYTYTFKNIVDKRDGKLGDEVKEEMFSAKFTLSYEF